MKTLYVCRLYSGFEESLRDRSWNPTGAPTIARMIEHMDTREDIDFNVILTQKSLHDPAFPKSINVEGLNTSFSILPGPSKMPKWLWKFRDKFSETLQFFSVLNTYLKNRPDIIYCDRGNILTAALLARFTNAVIVWRVMGVLGIMHKAADENTLRAAFLRWLWRSPFSAVICTRDGSDGDPWLKQNLHPETPYHMMLNGIDLDIEPEKCDLPGGIKALFVGRLEPMKGCEEFLEAVALVPELQAVMVGDGSLKPMLMEKARDLGIESRVHFLGARSAAQLKYIRQSCDFYVSLNTHGNLTNVNLEALSDHLPTIIPSANGQIDTDTNALIPESVFHRFGKVGDTQALVKAIEHMMVNKNRDKYRKAAKTCADDILHSWNERVQAEIDIYGGIKPHDKAIVIADLGSGGAQKVAISLTKELAGQGQKIAVITLQSAESDFHSLPNNITRITLERCNAYQGLQANVRRICALRKALKKTRAKQVISFIASTNILCIWACIGLHNRLAISERNDPARQSFGKMWDSLRKISYRFANIITANSQNAVQSMKTYVPAHKLHYIPNALSKPPPLPKQKEKTVLIVGRLHPQKEHHVLLDAFAHAYSKHPNWKLVIAGDGALRSDLEAQTKALNITDSVEFKGKVNDPYALYKKASIFVLPSLHEGTPNALLEAMSCACVPIISDACEGAMPYIQHEKSGLIFPVGNVEALSKALSTLMDDTEKSKALASQAQKNVTPLYSKNTAEVWSNVLKGAA